MMMVRICVLTPPTATGGPGTLVPRFLSPMALTAIFSPNATSSKAVTSASLGLPRGSMWRTASARNNFLALSFQIGNETDYNLQQLKLALQPN